MTKLQQSDTIERVTDLLLRAGWPRDLARESLESSHIDATNDSIGTHIVVRLVGRPALSVSLVSGIPTRSTSDELRRWAGNAAYNRHAALGSWLDADARGELLLTRWIADEKKEVLRASSEASRLALPFCARQFIDRISEPLSDAIGPEALARGTAQHQWKEAANKAGFHRRPSVDRLLLGQCLAFRTEVLRADDLRPLGAAERAHFDAALVTLMTRLLFVRHLEDRAIGSHRRGQLLGIADSESETLEGITTLFASLQKQFNSELFPAANAAAYRIPGLAPLAVKGFIHGLYEESNTGVRYDFGLLESDSLGLLYQQFAGLRWAGDRQSPQLRLVGKETPATENLRDRYGIFYTPPSVVDTILELTLGTWLRENDSFSSTKIPSILDLTAGSGVFLSRAFDYVVRSGGVPSWEDGRAWIEHCHGADIDSRAVSLARLNLWMAFARRFEDARLPSLAQTLRVADSLADENDLRTDTDSAPPLPRDWRTRGFDIVVGNPPFLGHRDAVLLFGARRVSMWRNRHRSGTKEVNLAALFVERGIRMLRPGGYLGMVLPRNLIKTESGESLRRLVRHSCEVVTVIDCLDAKLFDDADADATIVVLRRPRANAPSVSSGVALIVREAHADAFAPLAMIRHAPVSGGPVLEHSINIPSEHEILTGNHRSSTYEPAWLLEDGVGRCILDRLHGASETSLDEVARSTYAVDEGLRGAFVLTDVRLQKKRTVVAWSEALSANVEIEARLLRSAVRPPTIHPLRSNIDARTSLTERSAILYPYDENGAVVPWQQIQERLPLTAQYLLALQPSLVRRRGHGATDGWWVPRAVRKKAPWHRHREALPYVLQSRHSQWPRAMLVHPTAVAVGGGIAWTVCSGSSLAPEVLLALVSSRLWWWFVVIGGSVGRGKHYRIRPGVWESLKIPDSLRDKSRSGKSLMACLRRLRPGSRSATLSSLWERLDELIEDAYRLSSGEREHLARVLDVYTASPRSYWIGRTAADGSIADLPLFEGQ